MRAWGISMKFQKNELFVVEIEDIGNDGEGNLAVAVFAGGAPVGEAGLGVAAV